MQTSKEELKNVLYQAIQDECKIMNIKAPDYISEDEWFVAFDVFEAHYLANNMMDKYLYFIYWFVRVVTLFATDNYKDRVSDLFKYVYTYSALLEGIGGGIRLYEGKAICSEIEEKIKIKK